MHWLLSLVSCSSFGNHPVEKIIIVQEMRYMLNKKMKLLILTCLCTKLKRFMNLFFWDWNVICPRKWHFPCSLPTNLSSSIFSFHLRCIILQNPLRQAINPQQFSSIASISLRRFGWIQQWKHTSYLSHYYSVIPTLFVKSAFNARVNSSHFLIENALRFPWS